ncbi:MAG: bifunctional alpha,alpha-trehalose-phosphate synthase (UDP-forming)/trehalose-phosphatase [Kiritimatiellae bacterium]|nr:bifunctional alpha,alpha-trehalose-phosphate synthase (UDP-forming)/trehalose-phosphatase [Kiritimatiellia bacterium]
MRLIIIANRLPIKLGRSAGRVVFKRSEGGLATGLASLHAGFEIHWIGWPGTHFDSEMEQGHVTALLSRHSFHPVFLSQEQVEDYYEGYCNNIIWPLCHYFFAYIQYDQKALTAYREVNRAFFEAAKDLIQPGDRVWVQDYQLMLLPGMLREAFPDLSIGYFHHIPFPSYELFRVLPERAEILRGLLGADLIGFHTHDYMRHFISAAYRTLGLNCELDEIRFVDRLVQVNAFPMGIDFNAYNQAPKRTQVQAYCKTFRQQLGVQKLVLSVDRLDYSKGVLHRLKGFASALERYPELLEKVSLLMLLVPSRATVPEYAELKKKIDQTIGELNGLYATPNWTPVHYYYRSFSPDRLMALYHVSDIALVTPLRDGMNLVAKEYVAAKRDTPGVLILSERAGASIELTDALLVNPNDIEAIGDAIAAAVLMPEEEQLARLRRMQSLLARQNVDKWAADYIEALDVIRERNCVLREARIGDAHLQEIKQRYTAARKRLLILDYDGTLAPLRQQPEQAVPEARLVEILRRLSSMPGSTVAVCSGRDRETLDGWLGNLPVLLAAEHGAFYKEEGVWHSVTQKFPVWTQEILDVLERTTSQTPGSRVEKKQTALVWHYRNSDAWLADLREKQLINALMPLCARMDLHIMRGNKVVEIKCSNQNKGTEVRRLVSKDQYDFILAAGDDVTDEDMFSVLPPDAVTIRVGDFSQTARYSVGSQTEMLNFLEALARQEENAG